MFQVTGNAASNQRFTLRVCRRQSALIVDVRFARAMKAREGLASLSPDETSEISVKSAVVIVWEKQTNRTVSQ